MNKAAHRLALVAVPSAVSLRLLSSLSRCYSVNSWAASERVVVRFREERPALVVVLCSRRDQAAMRGVASRLKTEQRPPLVVLVCDRGLPSDASVFLQESACDGILGLPLTDEELFDGMAQVLSGSRVVRGPVQRAGKLRRAVRRLSGSRASSEDG